MKVLQNFFLEKEVFAFVDKLDSQGGKAIYQMTSQEARAFLEKLQSESACPLQGVNVEEKTISVEGGKKISLQIVRPQNSVEKLLPAVMFFHGAGWVMGSFQTHGRLVSEMAIGANVAVVFVNYTLSPEAKFPTAIEEAYEATKYIAQQGKEMHLDTSRLVICGDSVGGNMAIAVALLAKERGGPNIDSQVLFYPVTNSELTTPSYGWFAEGPWLTKKAMEWFWNNYAPNMEERKNILLSPYQATEDELKGLPPALIITAENDVLRDEGEAYAHKLMQAGVKVTAVRFLGTMHDFVMLNALSKTSPTKQAIVLTNAYIQERTSKN